MFNLSVYPLILHQPDYSLRQSIKDFERSQDVSASLTPNKQKLSPQNPLQYNFTLVAIALLHRRHRDKTVTVLTIPDLKPPDDVLVQ